MSPRWQCGRRPAFAAETFALEFVRTGSGGLITGYRFDRTAHDLHLLLPDPYTFPSSLLVEHLNTDLPERPWRAAWSAAGFDQATSG